MTPALGATTHCDGDTHTEEEAAHTKTWSVLPPGGRYRHPTQTTPTDPCRSRLRPPPLETPAVNLVPLRRWTILGSYSGPCCCCGWVDASSSENHARMLPDTL